MTHASLQSPTRASATGRVRPRKRLSRTELSPEARRAIFEAAAAVVGEHGYADATIRRITEAAGIAQGTFYLYFESRQALFDGLLPHVGERMLRFIGERTRGARDLYDMEERGFRAFFDYLTLNPGFFRILNEAEVAAPRAFQQHFRLLGDHYVASLQRAVKSGEIASFGAGEMETVAYMLMAARSYLYLRYVKDRPGSPTLPEEAVRTYLKMVRHGLK
jgi:AcrR family transcriptional regulator